MFSRRTLVRLVGLREKRFANIIKHQNKRITELEKKVESNRRIIGLGIKKMKQQP